MVGGGARRTRHERAEKRDRRRLLQRQQARVH